MFAGDRGISRAASFSNFLTISRASFIMCATRFQNAFAYENKYSLSLHHKIVTLLQLGAGINWVWRSPSFTLLNVESWAYETTWIQPSAFMQICFQIAHPYGHSSDSHFVYSPATTWQLGFPWQFMQIDDAWTACMREAIQLFLAPCLEEDQVCIQRDTLWTIISCLISWLQIYTNILGFIVQGSINPSTLQERLAEMCVKRRILYLKWRHY